MKYVKVNNLFDSDEAEYEYTKEQEKKLSEQKENCPTCGFGQFLYLQMLNLPCFCVCRKCGCVFLGQNELLEYNQKFPPKEGEANG